MFKKRQFSLPCPFLLSFLASAVPTRFPLSIALAFIFPHLIFLPFFFFLPFSFLFLDNPRTVQIFKQDYNVISKIIEGLADNLDFFFQVLTTPPPNGHSAMLSLRTAKLIASLFEPGCPLVDLLRAYDVVQVMFFAMFGQSKYQIFYNEGTRFMSTILDAEPLSVPEKYETKGMTERERVKDRSERRNERMRKERKEGEKEERKEA